MNRLGPAAPPARYRRRSGKARSRPLSRSRQWSFIPPAAFGQGLKPIAGQHRRLWFWAEGTTRTKATANREQEWVAADFEDCSIAARERPEFFTARSY